MPSKFVSTFEPSAAETLNLLLLRNLDPIELPQLEEREGVSINSRACSCPYTVLLHEVPVCGAACSNGLLELSDFHLTRLEETADFGADLVAADIDGLADVLVNIILWYFDFGLAFFGRWILGDC